MLADAIIKCATVASPDLYGFDESHANDYFDYSVKK
jgi:hypothetical protein